jgi:xanthine dehydrogenase molybdenum-binding subunit
MEQEKGNDEMTIHTLEHISSSIRQNDVLEKVLGTTRYSQDFWMEGMLYGGVLRSPHPAARIVSIRCEEAERLPGVYAVMTALDIPGQKYYGGPTVLDHPVLASDNVLYSGQAIALVAAESRKLVEQALQLIDVEYEPLPAIFDPGEAMKPEAPQIGKHGNIASHEWVRCGDLARGFAEADVVVEQTYQTSWIDHAPLEVECGSAWPDERGGITLRVSTQSLEYQQQIADVLGLPTDKIRVICPMVGGGFGRKLDITVELYLALLAWRTQHPVFLTSSREESMLAYSKHHPFTLHYKTGATKDGRLTAMDIHITADAGPFVYRSALVSVHSLMLATGPYYVPHASIDVQAIHTNNFITSAMRAVGGPQVNFAYESQMDQLAYQLVMNPLEFRRKNYLQPGQALPNGQVLQGPIMLADSAERALKALDEIPMVVQDGSKKIGRGISSNFSGYGVPGNTAECAIEIQADGHIMISIGVCDIGGGQRSSVAEIAANIFGVPLDDVILHLADTAITPLLVQLPGQKHSTTVAMLHS